MRAVLVVAAVVSSVALAQVEATSEKGTMQVGAGLKAKTRKGTVVLSPDGTVQATGANGNAAVLTPDGTVQAENARGAATVSGAAGRGDVVVTGSAAPGAGTVDVATGKVELRGAGIPLAHACQPGQPVEVRGTGNAVTLTGECGEVEVHGTGNNVSVDAAAKLDVHGTGNNVTWRRGAGGKPEPKVKLKGMGNVATRAAQ